jgi:rubrerythrin
VAVGLLGCSGGASAQSDGSPPDWFLSPGEAYDEERYLTAVASGPSAQAAQNKAFGNLARVFEADIEASKELRDDYQEVQTGGEVTSSTQETRLITRSDVRSDQKLLNSEVLERTQVGDTYYALVGMERQETVRIYAEEIRTNRSTIEDYRAAAQETDNPITRLAFLRKALVLAQVNERLTTQRNIVAGGSAPSTTSSPVAALE